jgi:PPM family protein phosphatase
MAQRSTVPVHPAGSAPAGVVDAAAASAAGPARTHNEDAWLAGPPLLAVADGVGGGPGGEVASWAAVQALPAGLADDGAPTERVARVVASAEAAVHAHAERDERLRGLSCTLTAALVEDGTLALAHVGDSFAGVLRGGRLRRLSAEHTLVAEYVRDGRLTPVAAERHPLRSVLTRWIGGAAPAEPQLRAVALVPGDVLLLCTDGVAREISEPEIAWLLGLDLPAKEIAQRLVMRARARGGSDDATAVVARIG